MSNLRTVLFKSTISTHYFYFWTNNMYRYFYLLQKIKIIYLLKFTQSRIIVASRHSEKNIFSYLKIGKCFEIIIKENNICSYFFISNLVEMYNLYKTKFFFK